MPGNSSIIIKFVNFKNNVFTHVKVLSVSLKLPNSVRLFAWNNDVAWRVMTQPQHQPKSNVIERIDEDDSDFSSSCDSMDPATTISPKNTINTTNSTKSDSRLLRVDAQSLSAICVELPAKTWTQMRSNTKIKWKVRFVAISAPPTATSSTIVNAQISTTSLASLASSIYDETDYNNNREKLEIDEQNTTAVSFVQQVSGAFFVDVVNEVRDCLPVRVASRSRQEIIANQNGLNQTQYNFSASTSQSSPTSSVSHCDDWLNYSALLVQPLNSNCLYQEEIELLPCQSFLIEKDFNDQERSTMIVGHRGMGQKSALNKFRENTIEKFKEASKLSPSKLQMIEFDIQITKDGHLIIMHNFYYWSEKHQRKYLIMDTDLQTLWSSRSIEDENAGVMPLLESVLREVPSHLGFDIEVKYPMQSDLAELETGHNFSHVFTNRNFLIDKIINTINSVQTKPFIEKLRRIQLTSSSSIDSGISSLSSSMSGCLPSEERFYSQTESSILSQSIVNSSRRIIFSSFNSDIAMMLKKKQNQYPVFFISRGGVTPEGKKKLFESGHFSLENTINVAKLLDLQGIVLLYHQDTINHLKRINQQKLQCYLYGDEISYANRDFSDGEMERLGVDALIVDEVDQFIQEL